MHISDTRPASRCYKILITMIEYLSDDNLSLAINDECTYRYFQDHVLCIFTILFFGSARHTIVCLIKFTRSKIYQCSDMHVCLEDNRSSTSSISTCWSSIRYSCFSSCTDTSVSSSTRLYLDRHSIVKFHRLFIDYKMMILVLSIVNLSIISIANTKNLQSSDKKIISINIRVMKIYISLTTSSRDV